MKSTYKLIWTDDAVEGIKEIIAYLEFKFAEKDIKKFVRELEKQLTLTWIINKLVHIRNYQCNIKSFVFKQNFYKIREIS